MSKSSIQMRLMPHEATLGHEGAALLSYLDKTPVDEIIFVVSHVEAMSPGLGTLGECQAQADQLQPIFEKLRDRQINASINMWWTCGFSDFASCSRNLCDKFNFRWAVNPAGEVSRSIACPRNGQWLDHVTKMYGIYGQLRPRILWLDDDVRARLRAAVKSTCFCEDCLSQFNRRCSQSFDRTALFAAIVADPPNPVRNAWLDFQADTFLHIAKSLADSVHAVSPQTRMGAMLSMPGEHWAEGRRFDQHLDALSAPGARAVTRPQLATYMETAGQVLLESFNGTRQTQAVVPDDVECFPEIDTAPQTGYNHSVTTAQFKFELCQAMGMPGVTAYLYASGTVLDEEIDRPMAEMLRKVRPRLDAIAALGLQRHQFRGLGLPWHEDEARHATGAGDIAVDAHRALERRCVWDTALTRLGFATVFDFTTANAVAGEMLAALAPQQLQQLFSTGVLLDGRAAETLVGIGKGHWAGLAGCAEPTPAATERICDDRFGPVRHMPMTIRMECPPRQFELLPGTRGISNVHAFDGTQVGHGIILFENELGGRTIVVPYDGQQGAIANSMFTSVSRQKQFNAIVHYLNRDAAPHGKVIDAPNAMILIAQQDGQLIVAVANFWPDTIENLAIELGHVDAVPEKIEFLDPAGQWQSVAVACRQTEPKAVRLEIDLNVHYLHVAVLRISLASNR